MFDRVQKCYVKRLHLVFDNGLYNWKDFYQKVKAVFIHPLITPF